MPEGDMVWRTARQLHASLAGQELTRSDFRVPRLATVDLRGRVVDEVRARGKHLLVRVSGGLTLHTHLRMDGSWRVFERGERWRGGPAFQIRVVLCTASVDAVGYRLPVVELVRTEAEGEIVGHLGPDLLGDDWDPDEAARRIRAEPGREVGVALLDQRNVAGIGTIYLSEVCFLAGTSPWTTVEDADDVPGLLGRAHELMNRNARAGTQVTTQDSRPGRNHWVYGRAGRPCGRCGNTVRSGELGRAPHERVVYWCPACQSPA
ncbi:endonuclease-8 [Haloactinopolyspora alba]|uniref:DNA-(apurinic or apyrimidinic site) lyase n=1 Tax=Haloactinopolyspora alba TaxID=648780 RepID=A0A2P8E714_9ACTN|nr:DNA-formamidopyrimidine glycosylase family protein [Haloactinopolyspora alba]PSL05260.1 endonuclease-8 [Haloactinopolyspora alba]